MRDYIIMTDSCCDLSQQEVEELDLTVLPLSFTIEGKTLLNTPDHADMSPEEFFAKIAAGADCTTAAVNVGQFTDAMEKVLQEGKDILSVCFSSALSTTYQSACIAAEDLREKYPEAKILVIDSLSASRGQGMLLYRAVRERREKNLTIDELDAYVRSIIQSQCHWFIVDDLNHLKRGGRVSSTAALRALVDKVGEIGVEPAKNQPMLICHANCPESVEYVKGLLKERFGVTDVRDEFIGPVIGAHTGCGTLGLFFVGTER